MPYDMPMSLDEALMDPETRRRALQFLGPVEEVPELSGTMGTASSLAPEPPGAGGSEFPEPAGTAETGPEDLMRRYLAAQQEDVREGRLNALGQGFGDAAETALGGIGLRYARGQYERPRAADDLLRAERVKTEVTKLAQPKAGAGKVPLSTDPTSEASRRKQSLVKATLGDVYADDEIARMSEAEAEAAMKYGSMRGTRETTREGHSDANERARLARAQRGQIWAEQRGLKWAEMDLDERELAERIAARDQAKETKATERIEDQAKDFGNKYTESGLPEFKDQYAKAQAIFAKYPKSLPGVGLAEGRVPRRLTSSDGKLLRTVAGQMLLAYKKSVTGLGSSQKEDEAIREATGLIQTGDDESLRMGVSILQDVMAAKEKALQAGYKQEAVDSVMQRLPKQSGTAGQPITEPRPRSVPSGKARVRLKNGGVMLVDRADLAEALADPEVEGEVR